MIFFYKESGSRNLGLGDIKSYIEDKLPVKVVIKNELLKEELASEIASIRVLDVCKPFNLNKPLPGETVFEKRVARGEASPRGVLYDGHHLQRLYWRMLPEDGRGLQEMHVVFTDRFFGTYDEDDMRYHGRVILLGYPTLISLTGLVEAPAKPREYYLARRLGEGAAVKVLESLKGRSLEHEDERTPEVLKGYVMQGVFYHFLGEAFCTAKKCRLYNAHWQEEVLNSQLSLPEFCEKHEKMIPVLNQYLNKFLRH
jgi:hypothetical protein